MFGLAGQIPQPNTMAGIRAAPPDARGGAVKERISAIVYVTN
jgi:hypothetical protein